MNDKVIVDTTVWSLLTRRSPSRLNPSEREVVAELSRLLLSGRVLMLGAIRQELLSGLRLPERWNTVVQWIDDLVHALATRVDHDHAARYHNRCAEHGVAATNYDMLICAMADRLKLPIFTMDADFVCYARCLNIALHSPTR